MLKLVKDFRDYQFVYYWYDQKIGRASPYLPTLNHAEDWFLQQQRANYSGTERRRPALDKNHSVQRRTADKKIKVDIDISRDKINELKESFAA